MMSDLLKSKESCVPSRTSINERCEGSYYGPVTLTGNSTAHLGNVNQQFTGGNHSHYTVEPASADFINFNDACGGQHRLPYQFFDQWETFCGWLRGKLARLSLPGGLHISNGDYVLHRGEHICIKLGPENWRSLVFPGCQVYLTIVIRYVQLSLRRCPRPRCESPASFDTESADFYTCEACGLCYRLQNITDDDCKADSSHHLNQQQKIADLKRFGERILPEDLAEGMSTGLAAEEVGDRNSLYMSAPETEGQPRKRLELEVPSQQGLTDTFAQDQPMGVVESWIFDSVISMHEPASIEHNEFELELQMTRRELHDLKYLKRVQFTSLTAEAQALHKSQPDYARMPLDKQIYLRKIVDKYPSLPSYLAERFAAGSLTRKSRLKGLNPIAPRNKSLNLRLPPQNQHMGTDLHVQAAKLSRSLIKASDRLESNGGTSRYHEGPVSDRHGPHPQQAHIETSSLSHVSKKHYSCHITERGIYIPGNSRKEPTQAYSQASTVAKL